MDLQQRINAFTQLGQKISDFSGSDLEKLAGQAFHKNQWFTTDSVKSAFTGIAKMLTVESLTNWTEKYNLNPTVKKEVGIVMAGNIPMVGFHDLLSVLISGHEVAIKKSSDDEILMSQLIEWLLKIEPTFDSFIKIPQSLKDVDAVIATGSDNTARYFEYYFGNKPNIIRKNRTSIAILSGNESPEQLNALGKDIFMYFGLGCRNVSKIYYPEEFDIRETFPHFESYEEIIHHNKYRNNYDYNKSILLVNKEPHYDTGFLMTKEDKNLVSPISTVFTEGYKDFTKLKSMIGTHQNKIQCIVGGDIVKQHFENSFPFGQAQYPDVWDYADNVDTLDFLVHLNT